MWFGAIRVIAFYFVFFSLATEALAQDDTAINDIIFPASIQVEIDGKSYGAIGFDILERSIGNSIEYNDDGALIDARVVFIARPGSTHTENPLSVPYEINHYYAGFTPLGRGDAGREVILLTISGTEQPFPLAPHYSMERQKQEPRNFFEKHLNQYRCYRGRFGVGKYFGNHSRCMSLIIGKISRSPLFNDKYRYAVEVERIIYIREARPDETTPFTSREVAEIVLGAAIN